MPGSTTEPRSRRRDESATLEPVVAQSTLSVAYEKTITRNLGDGNYVKISCRVELPYNPTLADKRAAKEALEAAEVLVDVQLEKSLTDFLED